VFSRDFYNKNLKEAARSLRNNMTPAEKKLWQEYLRYSKPRVHRQRAMGNFIVDFYIPKAKLVIEIDGNFHFDEKATAKDHERTSFLNEIGLEVLRFENHRVFNDFKSVCREIDVIIGSRYPTFQDTP
jgi:very-short-patch-repair endonuclease